MSNPNDYAVGWICGIGTDYVAARSFLDEVHPAPRSVDEHDGNRYTLGKIAGHFVVLAVSPDVEYGSTSAARVAEDMLNTFPNIKIGLLVGIGGGAPSQSNDIRLGDVVVGSPQDSNGGVVYFENEQSIQDRALRLTGRLNDPPMILQTALHRLDAARGDGESYKLEQAIDDALKKKPARLQENYLRPSPSRDQLYRSQVIYPLDDNHKCPEIFSDHPSHLVRRASRSGSQEGIAVHYGLIASAESVMKDAAARDKFADETGVLCFETGVTGMPSRFPCLAIRGICDYSDSHGNKEWRGYAAMAAAAFTKDLLRQFTPNEIEEEPKILELGLFKMADGQEDTVMGGTETEEGILTPKLSEKDEQCLQLLGPATNSTDSSYHWHKNWVGQAAANTCRWLLKHEEFDKWLRQTSGPLLITGNPGSGKSVLAKYLIDWGLPQSPTETICYFFFNSQDQKTLKQALRAVLHQLFLKKPCLIQHAVKVLQESGTFFANSTSSLWNLLRAVTSDPQAGSVIIVFDALNDCDALDFEDLVEEIQVQFRDKQSGGKQLKYLLMSRPSDSVMPYVERATSKHAHISLETEHDAIHQELDSLISLQVDKLSDKKMLSGETKNSIKERVTSNENKTYLWIDLIFDYLATEDFDEPSSSSHSSLAILPKTVEEVYEKVLHRSKESKIVQKALSIVLASDQLMSVSEMNVALNMGYEVKSICDLILETEGEFKSNLLSLAGLFLTIRHNKVSFRHKTAREFLVRGKESSPSTEGEPVRYRSISLPHENETMAEICVQYLNLLPFGEGADIPARLALLDYSARNWLKFFRRAKIPDGHPILPLAARLCDSSLELFPIWLKVSQERGILRTMTNATGLLVASHLGLAPVVKLFLDQPHDIEERDKHYNLTPLQWAASSDSHDTVKLLIEKGANLEAKNNSKETALALAARHGRTGIAKLLLEKGACFDVEDKGSMSPLLIAAMNRHTEIARHLLDLGAKLGDKDMQKSLCRAAEFGPTSMVELLLERGGDIETKNKEGCSLLILAAKNGHEDTVKFLVEKSAKIEETDELGRTALSWAAEDGNLETVEYLLEKGADSGSADLGGGTALLWAAGKGRVDAMKCLFEKSSAVINSTAHGGQNAFLLAASAGQVKSMEYLLGISNDMLGSVDVLGRNALLFAAMGGHVDAVKYLLEQADTLVGSIDNSGRNALSWAAENGQKDLIQHLLEKDVNVESADLAGRSALSWAAEAGQIDIVEYLLEKGAEAKSVDSSGRTALSWAAGRGRTSTLIYLVSMGLSIGATDNDGRTALSWASGNGYESTVKYILGRGEKIDSTDNTGRTVLSWAAASGHESLVSYLLGKGAEADSADGAGRTVLSWAAGHGHTNVVKMLQAAGANINSVDQRGWTPLWYAVAGGHEDAVVHLTMDGSDIKWLDQEGQSLLKQALLGCSEGVAQQLLRKGASVDTLSKPGRSLLSEASEEGNADIVRFLLENGANMEFKDQSGRTPLSLASGGGRQDVVQLLLTKGANTELADHQGRTPLSWACWKGHQPVVQLLVDSGADKDASDDQGRTALWYAEFSSFGEEGPIARILRDGANGI
ncbi:unnamed protein product [Clonostachys rhizophaga]|uniref:Ankyrin repeat domain-containing protein 50 n=1 Tax=Clonostachys rhizophaga TaxID=160324 RepID=A0A9N9YTJ6_9HYPO|nr:unnamed protein product [Clonostachys rhizophaga]